MDRSIVPVEEPLDVGSQIGSLLVQGLHETLEGVYDVGTIDGGALRCNPGDLVNQMTVLTNL